MPNNRCSQKEDFKQPSVQVDEPADAKSIYPTRLIPPSILEPSIQKNIIDDEPGFIDLLRKIAKEESRRELLASEHGTSSLCFDLKCSDRVLSPDVSKKKVTEAKSLTGNLSEAAVNGAQ
jgi:hypothetical protein